MADREKVIKGLECLAQKQEPMANPCSKCDYHDRPNFAFCVVDVATDALALLKEQEAVEPFSDDDGAYWCSSCNEDIVWRQKFCSNCGKPVLWKGRRSDGHQRD